MALDFLESPSYLFSSESVTEGHPDKLCDQISDAILDEILAQDPAGRVACETCVTTGLVVVMGEITTACYIDIPSVVRRAIREAGYTQSSYGFDYQSCGVVVSIQEQSADIALGVDRSVEAKKRGMNSNYSDDPDKIGAGDQGMMVGFACNETPDLMPMPIYLAQKLCRQLALVRREGILPYLRPDGKSQVTVEYSYGIPRRVHTVILAAQHNPEVSDSVIERDLIERVAKQVIPSSLRDKNTKYLVNSTGRFVIGGPVADTGLTGRKILVDTYGGAARHGGGAFSGKDPTKVDRSGAYAARYVAKNIVAAGLADRLEIQISYAIGVAHPVSISIETFGTNKVPHETIMKLVNKHFDLRPAAIMRDLNLRRPIYKQTATYGHFGRDDIDLPWEHTDKADILRREAFMGLGESRAVS
ncbi:MAG: methionine adenosyltransferase [Chloroflexi bacterium]|nr:methionine adenosyltransferase [Chloroflexota bacterium]